MASRYVARTAFLKTYPKIEVLTPNAATGDLKQEEEQAREEEEAEVESKRIAAQKLAVERGLAKTEETQDVGQ